MPACTQKLKLRQDSNAPCCRRRRWQRPPLLAATTLWLDPKPGGAVGGPPAAASLKERAASWPEELQAPRKENSARVRACMIACCLLLARMVWGTL
jgi:hypothetical protein